MTLYKKHYFLAGKRKWRKRHEVPFSLSNKEVSSEGMKPPSEIKREKEEEKGERVGMAGVP